MSEHEIDWAALEANLAEAKEWMTRPQPEDAAADHHGHLTYVGGGVCLQVAPNGSLAPTKGKPRQHAVVIFQQRVQNYGEHDQWEPDPFDQETLDRLERAVVDRYGRLVDRWNGAVGGKTVSFMVATDTSGVVDALHRYHEGCPEHNTVFCNGWQNGEYNKGCTYMSDALRREVPPNWVLVSEDREPVPQPPPPSRNAEVVAEMLDKVRPLLVEMGFHQATINASAAGELMGEVGAREFFYEHDERLGIQLPAEAFGELVRLAIIGHEFDGVA